MTFSPLHRLLATAFLTLACGAAHATPIALNLSTWAAQGDVSVQTGNPMGLSLGSSPTLVLGTASVSAQDDAPALAGAFNLSGHEVIAAGLDLEASVGLAPGALDDVGNGPAYEGSTVRLNTSADTGDVWSFDWRLLTQVNPGITPLPDTAWLIWQQGSETSHLVKLGDTFTLGMTSLGNGWQDSGWQHTSFVTPHAGSLSLALAVADVNSFDTTSALAIQNVVQTSAVPEASSILMVLAGLAMMLFMSIKNSNPNDRD